MCILFTPHQSCVKLLRIQTEHLHIESIQLAKREVALIVKQSQEKKMKENNLGCFVWPLLNIVESTETRSRRHSDLLPPKPGNQRYVLLSGKKLFAQYAA